MSVRGYPTPTGYLAYCRWCAHYVPASEQFARSPESATYVCPEGAARQAANPDLTVCPPGCGHVGNLGPLGRLDEDCPACGSYPPGGQNPVTRLDGGYLHYRCASPHGCGHTWLSGPRHEDVPTAPLPPHAEEPSHPVADISAAITTEQLRPYIAGAGTKVSGKRTDPSDIARILLDGAYSTEAQLLVKQCVSAKIPPAEAGASARLAELQAAQADLIAAGYSPAELARNPARAVRRFSSGNNWSYLADITRDLDALQAEADRHSALVDASVDRWYAEHADEIRQIADQETAALMATPQFRLRAWLMAHAPADKHGMVTITAAVRWFVAEYRCSEPSVWRWLSGDGGFPGWLTRELDQHQPPAQAGT